MKINYKKLITAVAIPLAVGGASAFITKDSFKKFSNLNQPPLSPPSWLFPIVWTILFVLMGVASYMVSASAKSGEKLKSALRTYGVQLAVNFVWPILFFNYNLFLIAFAWIILLWLLILKTIFAFAEISKKASFLLYPYIIWVTFAAYLNLGIYLLN